VVVSPVKRDRHLCHRGLLFDFRFSRESDLTVVEADIERHIDAVPVGSPFQDARRIIPGHLMHRLLIVIRYTVHRSLALQQLALAVSLVAVVGVIGDVSEGRIFIDRDTPMQFRVNAKRYLL